MMENVHQLPGAEAGITICIDPPKETQDHGPPSSTSISWGPEHYGGGQPSYNNEFNFGQEYPTSTSPQDIPRVNTGGFYDGPPGSPHAIWDAPRSPASSDFSSNASSPMAEHNGDDFRDDISDYAGSDHHSHVSDNEFDLTPFLNLDMGGVVASSVQQQSPVPLSPALQQSPDTLSPQFLSGSDPYSQGSAPGSPNPNYFLGELQTQYIPTYTDQHQLSPSQLSPSQLSPSQLSPSQLSPSHSSSSLQFANGFPSQPVHPQSAGGRPSHHQRSSSDFLLPPSPMTHRSRSHSRGHSYGGQGFVSAPPLGAVRGHRSTISEGTTFLNFLGPTDQLSTSPDSNSIFLGDAVRGRGLNRSKTAPSSHMGMGVGPSNGVHSRGRSPYERPSSQTSNYSQQDVVDPSLFAPSFEDSSSEFASDMELPSPSSANDANAQVATAAMIDASNRRRKREATFFCSSPGCPGSFTTENSKKRHERSHSGIKPYYCSIQGCGQTFSNDDDRKRHENKSKKHNPSPSS